MIKSLNRHFWCCMELNKLTFLASLPSFTSSRSFFSDVGVSSFFFSAFFVLKNGLSRYHVSFRKLESMRTDKLLFIQVKLLGTSRNSVEFTSFQPIQFSFLFCLVDYCSVFTGFWNIQEVKSINTYMNDK